MSDGGGGAGGNDVDNDVGDDDGDEDDAIRVALKEGTIARVGRFWLLINSNFSSLCLIDGGDSIF